MDRVGLHEPDVSVDARSLIKPAIAGGGVDAHEQDVLSAGICKAGYVEAERIVSAAVTADVKAVENHHRFPVGTIEFERNALVGVVGESSKMRRYQPTLVAG